MDYCKHCGRLIALARVELGYRSCLPCGQREAALVRHTIVPMHKSNYIPVSDRSLLAMLNPKRAIY